MNKELLKLEKEFLECGYTQESIDNIKGNRDIGTQIDNLCSEQEYWGEVEQI